ncbi:unnamed protein product [Arctia plantaginis]|uniref:CUB domain-containing protein n=1 Tax=Arctia plantaginis TaxID=874455 RepID=A0A8S1BA08_ARCPL|nr:unnamed protein product [Arctia plantaginis]
MLSWSKKSQVDLWTQSSSGCACPGDGGDDCACCVRDGACPCGGVAPTRCAQCGLEQYCANMCNITIDSRILKNKSGKTFGQIKSPSIEGPGACSYFLQPDAGQRVEIQLYRLVSVGKFNGTSCVGGWLQLGSASTVPANGAAETRLCGANERYSPPVVLFADHGASTLEFRITEKTVRSQFLAFFSFTSLSNTQGVGFHPRGGSRIPQTDCDWLYQDVSCRGPGTCVLASPGYPGLYPPHRRCRYLFTTNSVHTRVKIIFTSILLPRNHCNTDYLTLRAGSSPSASLLGTLCTERTATLEHPGPNLLLEFNSGPLVPPYDYNGFIAKLEFIERIESSGSPPTVVPASPPLAALTHHMQYVDRMPVDSNGITNEVSSENGARVGCGSTVRGYGAGGARSGHFDTRASAWRAQCVIHLLGAHSDVVQVSLFNYNLRLQSCRSHIEILEGIHEFGGRGERDRSERGDRALLKECGPTVREARDPSGRFLIRQAVMSKGANLTILVRRASTQIADEEEFVDGAFAFHDEQHEGTASPDSTCASTHYGLASPAHGGVSAPSHHHIFWNIEERLLCTHRFIPAANQSVTIEIQRLERMLSAEPTGTVVGAGGCRTACGDAGCECRSNTPLYYHDHIALVAGDGTHLSCLCGDFQAAWLPVVVRSWTSVRLEYSVAHYTYTSRGFDYAAAYSFNDDAMCGQRTYTTHSGEISSRNVSVTGSLNEFFYQQCTWVLDSNVERQLFIDITSEQDKSCGSWNITLHEWSGPGTNDAGLAGTAGELLYTFCARHKNHTYTLPWRLNTVVIRLVALSRQQPLYTIRWRSQVVRANNRLGPPTPAPAASAAADTITMTHRLLYCIVWLSVLEL